MFWAASCFELGNETVPQHALIPLQLIALRNAMNEAVTQADEAVIARQLADNVRVVFLVALNAPGVCRFVMVFKPKRACLMNGSFRPLRLCGMAHVLLCRNVCVPGSKAAT